MEREAYWGGLIVATVMLGSGFSLLLFPAFIGYGAVIMSLGIMTMVLVLMTKTLVVEIQKWMDYNARIEETVSNILALRTQEAQRRLKDTDVQRKKETVEEEEIEAAA